MDIKSAEKLNYWELVKYTDNFSEDNFLGTCQFGKVYRGKIELFPHEFQHVMVKIWEEREGGGYIYHLGDHEARLMHEMALLRREKLIHNHPGMIELQGYCWDDEHLAAIYNFKPLDIVENLIPRDTFTWFQRIKVAVGIASVIKFLHARNQGREPFLISNISASHIVVDEEFNPKLYDFGMISGGFFRDRTVYKSRSRIACYGYIDPCRQQLGEQTDVFEFGSLLLYLITKRVLDDGDGQNGLDKITYYWAWRHYKSCETTDRNIRDFVSESLAADPEFCKSDGRKITKLVMNCILDDPSLRPSMKEVLRRLLKLQVIKKHAVSLGLVAEPTSWFV